MHDTAMNFSLQGRTALVTGASRGIGFGLAHALSEAGARVAVAARDIDSLEGLARSIDGFAVRMDVASVADVQRATREVLDEFG